MLDDIFEVFELDIIQLSDVSGFDFDIQQCGDNQRCTVVARGAISRTIAALNAFEPTAIVFRVHLGNSGLGSRAPQLAIHR